MVSENKSGVQGLNIGDFMGDGAKYMGLWGKSQILRNNIDSVDSAHVSSV